MRITSFVSRFSGNVTYDDDTTGSFHTQWEGDYDHWTAWSSTRLASISTMRQISWYEPTPDVYPYWTAIGQGITRLPFLSFVWDTLHPTTQKNVTDMTARLDMLLARDDNLTYAVAVVWDGINDDVRVELPDLATGAENLADFKIALQAMFRLIMDTANVA